VAAGEEARRGGAGERQGEEEGEGARPAGSQGACYCRTAEALQCTADLTERDCRRRCDEALCDDWFWKERLPCWNWGYGG